MDSKKSLAFVGTASNVGKSTIAASVMRYYTNNNIDVVPFKAMNITSNIGVSKENLVMALSQIRQAEACLKKPSILYNPILIKPTSHGMEVYLRGVVQNKIIDSRTMLDECYNDYLELREKHQLIVIEGSGSCAELNLKGNDIANFPFIKKINCPTILVADIENCGIFASVYGTIALLDKEERDLIKGIIINKYCGEVDYFNEARKLLEDLVKIPIIGVVPVNVNSTSFEDMWESVCDNLNMELLDAIIINEI